MIWYKHEYMYFFNLSCTVNVFMDDCMHDSFFPCQIPFFSLLTCNMHNSISLKIPRDRVGNSNVKLDQCKAKQEFSEGWKASVVIFCSNSLSHLQLLVTSS